ncbi:peroxidasin homolog isoform X3 [Ctenopharyngodon idella]|uniref:peroxidasin homolog isoform X3 n=1 Tax=Ctenopharyngodon idella TaxID=7959 RepID=UPI0022306066|nr:peroxidasin homolog isoform X3 [Ctenopharyngodon idella]
MRGNMETKKFFLSLFAVTAFLHGVSAVGSVSVSVMEGDSVTLKTGVKTNQQEKIKWYFNDTLIAHINGSLSDICTDKGNERFKHRLKLDHQTGSLTIMNIRNTHSGVYKAVIIKKSENETIFYVTVFGVPAPVSVKEGESVTIGPGVINDSNDVMIWSFSGRPIAQITGNQSKIFTEEQGDDGVRSVRYRLNVTQTGSLTIKNTRSTDSGLYQLQISSSRFNITRSFCVCVTGLP